MDPRKRRTRTRLRKSLIMLMCEKAFDEILVIELVEKADVALPTFYRNYANKQDLLRDTVTHITEQFDASIYDAKLSILDLLEVDAFSPTLPLLLYIDSQKYFFRQLLQSAYVMTILEASYTKAKAVIHASTPNWTREEVDLIIGCILGNIYQWVLLDLPFSPHMLAKQLHGITSYGVLMMRSENTEMRQQLKQHITESMHE